MNNLSYSIIVSPSDDSSFTASYDYFIVSKGAEARSYMACLQIDRVINTKNMIVFDSQMNQDKLDRAENEQYNSIEDIISHISIDNCLTVPAENTRLGVILSKCCLPQTSRIALDISSMNFWELQDVVYYLLKVLKVSVLDVYYTEPDLYRYENVDITQYQHDEYLVSLNYPPNYYSTRTTEDEEIFVGILGFQKHVLKLLQDNNEVTDFYSINGFPSFYPKAKDISQVNNWEFLAQLQNSHKYSADASNPFLCYNALTDIHNVSKKAFMTICPLGSKPMLLGALLFVLRHSKNTRIVYPYSENIRTKTDGVGRMYCFRIMN